MTDLDTFFDGLRGQHPPGSFASPGEVRRRGRSRQRRQVLVAGLAVLVVAGAGGWAATRTMSSPEPAPVAAPSTAVSAPAPDAGDPAGWPLTAADLGPGWREAEHELLEGPWYWGECEAFPLHAAESLERRSYVDAVSFVNGGVRLSQVLERYPTPGDAAANLRDVVTYLSRCSLASGSGGEVAPIYYEFLTPGVGGNESFLVRSVALDPVHPDGLPDVGGAEDDPALDRYEEYVAVVLKGEIVTTLISADLETVRMSVPIAADRLP